MTERDIQYAGTASVYIKLGCVPNGCQNAQGPDQHGYYTCAELTARQVKYKLERPEGCDNAYVDSRQGTLRQQKGSNRWEFIPLEQE